MKKVISLLFVLSPAICCIAQLPTIYASGGETKVNWDYREKQTIENEDEAHWRFRNLLNRGIESWQKLYHQWVCDDYLLNN